MLSPPLVISAVALSYSICWVAGLQCTFEEGEEGQEAGGCVWEWFPKNDSIQVVTGREAVNTLMSEPPGDMTAATVDADNNTDGHYLLMFDWGREVNARLTSPWFRQSGESCRLQMSVHYFSADRSYIAVIVNKTSSPHNPIFVTGKYGGRKINTWDTFTEKIGKISEPFQLTVEVRVMSGRPRNHIALDNIQLINCGRDTEHLSTAGNRSLCNDHGQFKCDEGLCISSDRVCDVTIDCIQADDELQQCDQMPRGARCDFENGTCGWLADRGQLKWRLHSGPALSAYTGPLTDHTLQTQAGSYMFLDIRGGDFAYYAIFKSPWFPPMPDYNRNADSPYYKSCMLRFYVHLYGTHIGELAVYIGDSVSGRTAIWRHFGTRSNSWERVTVALPVEYNSSYFLEFQGARSFGNKGNMGLDDITLSPECFALRVPRDLAQQYSFDLHNSSSWQSDRRSWKQPNGKVYSFTTCATAGPRGPQQRACARAYANTNVQVKVLQYPKYKGFQTWKVPTTGIYAIIAAGASGGAGFDSSSGATRASEAVSVVKLHSDEELYLVVGQQGTNACNENASRFYRESCQTRYTALANPENFGSAYMGPTEPPSSTQNYHAALREIIDSARKPDQLRRVVKNRRINSFSSLPLDSAASDWRGDALARLRLTRSVITEEPINALQQIQFIGGGGGGGGGTFVFKMVSGKHVPIVVAGGSGGLSDDLSDLVSPHGRGENRSAEPYSGQTIYPHRAGPGGGWRGSTDTASAGKSLLEGAEGGAPCPNASRWHTHGGFGGGGGGCSAGGGGGGFTGGSSFRGSRQNGEGGWSFSSGLYRVVREAGHTGPGHVFIIPAFRGCGCEYLCVAVDEHLLSTRCICQDGGYLMPDKVSCQGSGSWANLEHWTDILLVVLAALAAAFFIVLALLAACYCSTYHRRKKLARHRDMAPLQLNRLRSSSGDILTEYNPNYEFGGTLPCSVKELKEIPRENLTLVRQLGQGAFGMVHQGYMRSSASDSVEMTVAVKTLAELSAPQAELDFIMEAVIMSRFDHPNIVHFIGVSFDRHPRYIVLELLSGGDLKSFLRDVRPTKDRPSPLTMSDLLTGAIDVAKGLEYLEMKRFIHRDIAARNCLLTTKGPGRVVKIADFGMSKDIYRADYYRKGGRTMIPVKWMPPEAFLDGVFTSKTDVWSFGVLLWEVMSLGLLPYPGRGNTEVMQLVMDGHRLSRPPNCPPVLHELMLLCWHQQPESRPPFSTLLARLECCIQDPEVLNAELPVFDESGITDTDASLTLECREPGSPPQSPDPNQVNTHGFSSTDYLLPSISTVATIATIGKDGSTTHL